MRVIIAYARNDFSKNNIYRNYQMNKKRIFFILLALSAVIVVFVGVSNRAPAKIVPSATIFMDKSGFTPREITIRRGQAVEFVNRESSECPVSDASCNFWPASDVHPTHELYPEFDPQQPIAPGQSWSFAFDRIGNWGFHDHFKPNSRGVIRVIE